MAKAWKSLTIIIVETKKRVNKAPIHPKMKAIGCDQFPKFEKIWHPWIKYCLPLGFDDTLLMPS